MRPRCRGSPARAAARYTKATNAATVAAAINYAVQSGFARSADFDQSTATEYLPVSPIVGTVNLENARDTDGNSLPNTDIVSSASQALPQRSNVLITAGFAMPGFDGRIRAYRSYKPVADSTKPTGWKFVNDTTALWPDLDGRPELKGLARAPADPNIRNIYTYLPSGSGGGSMVAFTTANAPLLAAHMGVGSNTSTLISMIRAQPLGAVIGSTPALMDAPSLDPPPDTDYGRSDGSGTFAGDHKNRRSLIFVGANDGMIHAIDARPGWKCGRSCRTTCCRSSGAERRPAVGSSTTSWTARRKSPRSRSAITGAASGCCSGKATAARSTRRSTSPRPGWGCAPISDGISDVNRSSLAVRHSRRDHRVQVGVSRATLRSGYDQHAGTPFGDGQVLRRPSAGDSPRRRSGTPGPTPRSATETSIDRSMR